MALAGVLLIVPGHAQVSEQDDAALTRGNARRGAAKTLVPRPELALASQRVVAATNALRQTEGLRSVEPEPGLDRAARQFADFMARTDKYGHGADGNAPAARAKKAGYDYCIVSENIAYQYSSIGFATAGLAQRFFEGWKNSPGHSENMLDPSVTDTAVAIAHSANTGHYYAVQLFGQPKSASIRFSVANGADVAVEYAIDGETFPLPPRVTRTHQRCRLPVLGFQGKTLEPRNGQRMLIVVENGALRLAEDARDK